MNQKMSVALVPLDRIERKIRLIRGQKVILDRDLALLYGVSTTRFNEAVKRNAKRFPPDFMFRLNHAEFANWISQIATSNPSARMGQRKLPTAFTEHGALAAAFILNSSIAVSVGTQVVRTFVRLRQMLASHADLGRKLKEMEKKYDKRFLIVFTELQKLMTPPPVPKSRPIGFGKN